MNGDVDLIMVIAAILKHVVSDEDPQGTDRSAYEAQLLLQVEDSGHVESFNLSLSLCGFERF